MFHTYLKFIVAVIVLSGVLWLLFKPAKLKGLAPAEYYTEEEMESFTDSVAAAFGEDCMVFHERISPDVHIDILLFNPTNNARSIPSAPWVWGRTACPYRRKNGKGKSPQMHRNAPCCSPGVTV